MQYRHPFLLVLSVAALVAAADSKKPEPKKLDVAPRHKEFTQLTIHFVGSVVAAELLDDKDPAELRTKLARQSLVDVGTLLERHGDFPPHRATWEDPDAIDHWQGATKKLSDSLASATAAAEKNDLAVEAASALRDQWVAAATAHSGYPDGTIEFLTFRAVLKAARDLPPDVRQRHQQKLLERLTAGRDRFVAARRPLLASDAVGEFDERVKKLHADMKAIVLTEGPISDKAVKDLHDHFPPLHNPSVLDALLERKRK